MRRSAAVGVLLGALALVAVVRAVPAGAAAACAAPPAGMSSVAVVVDTGTGAPLVRCVTVRAGASGRDALVAAGVPFRVGSGTPADNNQGGAFLCGILGVPQSGCAAPSSKGVAYWAYYRQAAGAPWTYSRVGFFTPVASRCAVEGWRWTTSGGVAATDNPVPRVAPPEVSCATTTTPAAPGTTAAPAARVPATTVPPRPVTTSAPAAAPAAAPGAAPAAAPSTTVPAAEVAGRTTVAPAPSTTAPGGRSPTTTRGPEPGRAGTSELAEGPSSGRSGGGVPWVAAAAVLAAALIGLGAFVRGRRAG